MLVKLLCLSVVLQSPSLFARGSRPKVAMDRIILANMGKGIYSNLFLNRTSSDGAMNAAMLFFQFYEIIAVASVRLDLLT